MLEFEVGHKVFLKLFPWKGVIKFGWKEKLSLRYIGPYEILAHMGLVAYKLKLITELPRIHNVFHVPMLKKHVFDSLHIRQDQPIEIEEALTYEEKSSCVLDKKRTSIENKSYFYG